MKPIHTLPALLLIASCWSPGPQEAPAPAEVAAPTDAEELVRQYAARSGYDITYDQGTAELLASVTVTPVGPQGQRLLRIARSEAAPAPQAVTPALEVVALRFASAADLADTLSGLVGAASGGTPEPAVRILADARTNSLLVSAPAEHMQQLHELIARLDREIPAEG